MNPERFERCRAIFEEAVELPDGERAAFVSRRCGDDTDLAREVLAMLASDSSAEERDFLGKGQAIELLEGATDLSGMRIGQYTIRGTIAVGGMGTVYEAEQESPRRKVALKILRSMFATPAVLRRFQVEAEILARLQHPGIARVFESGIHVVAAEGFRTELPWYTLELLEGARPITTYAHQAALSLDGRLDLFARVCAAVHHAHSRGVIHRDLKPANILVDSNGEPKVIDFGVSRARRGDTDLTSVHTQVGELIGTVRYMAPEQFTGDPDAVDTRTDVYALGIVLYELLCDAMPFDFTGRSLTEVSKLVQETAPRPPRRVRSDLPEEVEWLVLKALEKEPARRYASAAEMREDIERYRLGEPLLAGPPSAAYRARKFIGRYRFALGAAVAIIVSLTGGLVASLSSLDRAQAAEGRASNEATIARAAEAKAGEEAKAARAAEKKAEQEATVSSHVIDLFQRAFSEAMVGNKGRDLKVVDVLDDSSKYADDVLKTEPRVAGLFHHKLAELYYSLAELDSAAEHFTREIELIAASGSDDPKQEVTARMNLAQVLVKKSQPEAALEQLAKARSAVESKVESSDKIWGGLRHLQGAILYSQMKIKESEVEFRAAAEARRAATGPRSEETLDSLNSLANALMDLGKLKEADPIAREVLDGLVETKGKDHPFTLMARMNLGTLLRDLGKSQEAYDLLAPDIAIRERDSGPEHRDTLQLKIHVAHLLGNLKRYDEAIAMAASVVEPTAKRFGRAHPETLGAISMQVMLMIAGQHYAEAEQAARAGLDGIEPKDSNILIAKYGELRAAMGHAIGMQDRIDEGLAELDAGLELLRKTRGKDSATTKEFERRRAKVANRREPGK